MSSDSTKILMLEMKKKILNSSPYWKYINMELVEFTETGCVITMKVGDDHINMHGTAHGGTIASIADASCGGSLLIDLEENEFVVTENMIVNYFRPVEKGILTGKGWIVNRSGRRAVMEADIFDESGHKVAHAQTTHVIIRPEKQ